MVREHIRIGIFLIVTVLSYLFFLIPSTHGALLYFEPSATEIFRGDTAILSLRLDTDEGECINTVDAVIRYDSSIRIVDVSRGDSILNIWVENPIINETERTITFAGGIPGGYCGRIPGDPRLTNTLLSLIVRSPGFNIGGSSNPTARIWLDDSTQVLLHDGFGSNAEVRLQDATITLLTTPGNAQNDTWRTVVLNDTEPPSDFNITLVRDESAFSGKYFIVFNAVDKQSGIHHYQVMEEPFREFEAFKWGGVNTPWTIAESPYVLKDQTLNSTIRVKAIDKAGNERIATLVPDTALRSLSRDTQIVLGIGGGFSVIVVALVVYALWRRRQRIISGEINTV